MDFDQVTVKVVNSNNLCIFILRTAYKCLDYNDKWQ